MSQRGSVLSRGRVGMPPTRVMMRVLALVGIAAPLVAMGAQGASARGGTRNGEPISRGIAILPETVTVGDPFRVVVRIRAPRGATLEFPQSPDSGTGVEPLDPVSVVPSSDTSATEQTATYRLAAWDVGARAIRFPDILVREGSVTRRVDLGRQLSVFVSSVLPKDSTERVPKPARPLFEFGPPWWWWALVAAAALGILSIVWWAWRRRREAARPPIRTPREDAEEAFARIEALQLVASGERGQHVALMADVLRTYLSRVLPAAAPSLTTTELLPRLRGDTRLALPRFARLLHEVDLVKFAAAPIDAARAEAASAESRALVVAVDDALNAVVREAA